MKKFGMALLCLGSLAAAYQAGGSVGADAVWHPSENFLAKTQKFCRASADADYGSCFLSQMKGSGGASPGAVAFSRRLMDGSGGQVGYLENFREAKPVSVAAASYPLRANENEGCLLLNGQPPIIDVDDMKRVPRKSLPQNQTYAALAKQYPKATLFPGDRGGDSCPHPEASPSGGQRFTVGYFIQDGCHACARIGMAYFAFDFEAIGKLSDVKLVRVESKNSAAGDNH